MLLILFLSVLELANFSFLPLVKATYVEGNITEDTVWTLVDSPFIISNNVIVYSNATLTIEPNVEVRFGGNFSLIVNGKLVANGTQARPIKFTSSKIVPENGDWGAIRLSGGEASSLVYCLIEFGSNGLQIDSGNVFVKETVIRLNSENGILVNDGTVTVENSEISNNTLNGILIYGCNQASLKYNTIRSNMDGITLIGHITSPINIEWNHVLFNSHSGIFLQADDYTNTVIFNNMIRGNLYGFCISTDANTFITRNYISNNTVGIKYERGIYHQAHFNNIYENVIGMEAPLTARVNATQNYWGDRSGPYHESLNPYGKGNPVNSDGVNIDFIFYLTASIDHLNERPTAVLLSDKEVIAPNQPVTFIGFNSFDDGRVDQYFFDFGDGQNSGWTTLSIVNHTYPALLNQSYFATLTVMDDFGVISENAANITITVQDFEPLNVIVQLSNHVVNYTEEVAVTVYVSNATAPIENASVLLFAVGGGEFAAASGWTDVNGYFTTIFTSPNVTEIADVRIIARASMTGYADGAHYDYVKVLPPIIVEVTPEISMIKSEATMKVTVKTSLGFRWPIENALIIASCTGGTISPLDSGVTDENGTALFEFKAPQVLTQTVVSIRAIARKEGYAQGQNQATVTVEPRLLAATANANPSVILSEATSSISVYVASDGQPIANAIVIPSVSCGEISSTTNATSSGGLATFTFKAPMVEVREGLTANITFAISKEGYVDTETSTIVYIIAKTFLVSFTATTNETVSEGKVNITVNVLSQYELKPVQEANVTFTSEAGGSFVPVFGLTDSYGNVTLEFTAPQVGEPTLVNITAHVSKAGFITAEEPLSFYVSQGMLNISVTVDSTVIASNETIVVNVRASRDGTSVANVSVSVSADYGSFVNATAVTDSEGLCQFIYRAPETVIQLPVVLTVNASKYGYTDAEGMLDLTVTPMAPVEGDGGLSLMMVLLVLVLVVVAVVLLLLWKFKIIMISAEEEE